jgi:hypothetical protein
MGCCASALGKRKCTDYDAGEEGIFICDGKCGQTKNVWGTGPYTADSCVCRAARHAGVIGESGGVFKVTVAPGQSAYQSSTANGITSTSYGNYHKSIVITGVLG